MSDTYTETRLIKPETRQTVFKRDGLECHYCGCELIPEAVNQYSPAAIKAAERLGIPRRGKWVKKVNYHRAIIEHIVPHVLGGESDIDNFVACCAWDNANRGHGDYEEYRQDVRDMLDAGDHPCM